MIKRSIIRPVILISILPAHEFGHYLFGHKLLGLPVLRWSINFVTFEFIRIPSAAQEVLLYTGGFLFTFIPSVILTAILIKKRSLNWDLPFLWLMASPGVAVYDLAHVVGLIYPMLSPICSMIAGCSTAVMFLIFTNALVKKRS